MQTPLAEAQALTGEFPKPHADRLVASAFGLLTIGLRGKPEQRTGARLRIALLFDRPVHGAPPCSMDFRLRKQTQRAEHVEKQASRENNAQAQDIMRALAALYRELAEELQDSGLFEGRFLPLGFADLPGGDRSMIAGPITGAGHGAP